MNDGESRNTILNRQVAAPSAQPFCWRTNMIHGALDGRRDVWLRGECLDIRHSYHSQYVVLAEPF